MRIHVIYNRRTQLYFVILLPAVFLLAARGEQSSGNSEAGKPKIALDAASQEEKLPAISSPAGPAEPVKSGPKPREIIPADPPEDESQKEQAFEDVDWGREVNLDEMIAMAKKGRIVEIQ